MDEVSIHRACIKQKKRFGKGQRITDFCCFKAKSKALSSMSRMISRMSISWYGKTQAPGAFWAHPGCDLSHPSNGDQSIQEFQRTEETFPFSVRPDLAYGSFWKLPSDQILQPKLHPKRWPKLGDAGQFHPTKLKFAPPPKKNLRVWGGGGNKKFTNSCHGCQNGVFFAGFLAGETTHPWDTPTYLNATATGWQLPNQPHCHHSTN